MESSTSIDFSRRRILAGAFGASITPLLPVSRLIAGRSRPNEITFGLVTYLWGRDLPLPELLGVCRASELLGVELRTTHAHGVEPDLSKEARADVRAAFRESGVTLVGLGSDERFDAPDPVRVRAAIEATRAFLQLSHDIGGGGVKVKPDRFHEGVPRERTITQIASSLREVGGFAADLGQEVRLEVHGGCADPRVIRQIMEEVDSPAVRVCWNCNAQDLDSPGLEENFKLLRPYMGDTLHVRELDGEDYPYALLFRLLEESDWKGWMLLEAHTTPPALEHREGALRRQRRLFNALRRRVVWTPSREQSNLTTRKTPEGIEVLLGDELLAATRRTPKGPVLFPINVPGGGRIVRGHPIETAAGEAEDHPHHRSLWLAHGDVDGHDFWHDPEAVVHLLSEEVLLSDCETTLIRWSAEWRVGAEAILEEERTMRFTATESSGRIEFDLTLRPVGETVRFGDTKEGFFAIRLAPSLKVEGGPAARGRLQNAEDFADRDAWGRRSPWILAEGPLEGRLVRVRLSDDERNLRHPTWWHARTYGLLAANPFGRRAFEGGQDSGSMVVTRAQPLRLRYQLDFDAR